MPRRRIVVVAGYGGEPYLRFAAGTVYANARSRTTYVNRAEAPPATASREAVQPRWRKVHEGTTYTWRDRRTYWTRSTRPPAVERDPDTRRHVRDWAVPGTVDGRRFTIVGSLDWAAEDGGLGWQWFLVPILAAGFFYAVLATFAPSRRAPSKNA